MFSVVVQPLVEKVTFASRCFEEAEHQRAEHGPGTDPPTRTIRGSAGAVELGGQHKENQYQGQG